MTPSFDPALREAILGWYDERGRSLPFRGVGDPYLVLVSEVMAQQTQIGRVADAWRSFTTRFPTVDALAAASPADVLRAWRGLGYNRRALNLRRAAVAIVADHGGSVPDDVAALERLPGVGPYTARAVASIAFGVPVGAVDTNVRRVLARSVAGGVDAITAPDLQRLADAAVPPDRAADWTHAVMDVGATLCRPARPDCPACPVTRWCRFAGLAAQHARGDAPGRDGRGPFAATLRWLRGRLLDSLRDAPDGGWVELSAPIGAHDEAAVRAALEALAREGLAELDPGGGLAARLPIA